MDRITALQIVLECLNDSATATICHCMGESPEDTEGRIVEAISVIERLLEDAKES